jgi:glycosyltransferase involved in cell wall biosynthesis
MKILIFYHKLSERNGGPPTYLYNLRKSTLKNNLSIDFLSDYLNDEKVVYSSIRNLKIKFVGGLNPNLVALYQIYKLNKRNEYNYLDKIKLDKYDIIHFHSTFDLYKYYPYLKKNYSGKIILTTHSPKAYHLEYIEDVLKTSVGKIWNNVFKKLLAIDEFAFKNADALVFPCEEALEPYFNTWKNFSEIIKNKKIGYFLTSSPEASVKKDNIQIRESLNIPNDAFVIVYAGRHNYVKGYDLLKEIAQNILENEKIKDVYFLILGKEEPICGLKNSRWIEVGWTSDPHSYISAGNLFILPNRETFFDLILIEVLSLGKLLLLSETGGNRFFSNYKDSGIFFFKKENVNDAVNKINFIASKSKLENSFLEKINFDIYNKYFLLDDFALNYLECVKKITAYD